MRTWPFFTEHLTYWADSNTIHHGEFDAWIDEQVRRAWIRTDARLTRVARDGHVRLNELHARALRIGRDDEVRRRPEEGQTTDGTT